MNENDLELQELILDYINKMIKVNFHQLRSHFSEIDSFTVRVAAAELVIKDKIRINWDREYERIN